MYSELKLRGKKTRIISMPNRKERKLECKRDSWIDKDGEKYELIGCFQTSSVQTF